jgi:hypothetical protein
MKKRIIYLITLLKAIWLSSCRLSTPAVYAPPEGKILELGTLKPIEGATVFLSDCDGEVLGNSNCITIDSTTSDAQGHYAFTRTGSRVQARKSGYFSDDTTEKPVLYDSETMTDIVLPPHAWLQVKLINESGAFAISCSELSFLNLIQLPIYSDSVFIIKRRGNEKYKLIYQVLPLENTFSDIQRDTIYLLGHDTTKLTINY